MRSFLLATAFLLVAQTASAGAGWSLFGNAHVAGSTVVLLAEA